MKIFEPFELLLIGIANLLFNLGLALYESLVFGRYSWWWKIRLGFLKQYFLSGTYGLVKREAKDYRYPLANFIYGETPCFTLKQILEACNAKPGGYFVDLGSGRGLTVFYAHYLKDMKASGYELLPTFVRKARNIAAFLKQKKIKFHQEDILKADISKADIIYIAGTTFPDSFIQKLNRKLRSAPLGCYVVTLSYSLPEKYFNLYKEAELYFTWGKTYVYFHKRRNRR